MIWLILRMVIAFSKIQTLQVNEVIGEGGFARCFSAAWETGPPAERDSVLKVVIILPI